MVPGSVYHERMSECNNITLGHLELWDALIVSVLQASSVISYGI